MDVCCRNKCEFTQQEMAAELRCRPFLCLSAETASGKQFAPRHDISINVVCATSKASDAYAQSDQSLCLSLEYFMTVKLLPEHHLEFLGLKEGCTGSSESTPVKMTLW